MSLAAEFPNDNPDLHEGAIWVCLDVTGLPVAERRAQPIVVAESIAEPAPVEPLLEVATIEETEPPPVRESGIFMVLDTFSSLEDEQGEEEEEILVEELGPLEDAILEEAAPIVALEPEPEPMTVEAVVVEPEPVVAAVVTIAPPAPDDAFVVFVSTMVDIAISHGATAAANDLPATLDADQIGRAWAGILRGTSEDWDAVGGSMLDEWAADVLARATGIDAQTLKRDLRARGIAAFGLAA